MAIKLENAKILILSILPLVAYYAFETLYGTKAAIAATVVVTIAEIVYRKIKKQQLDNLFWFVAITTIGFGLIDVFSKSMSFFKYEAVLTNFVFGGYFVWGALTPEPLILSFAMRAGKLPNPVPEDLVEFLRIQTWIWAIYFIMKAAVYLAIANEPETSTSKMMVIRFFIGNASMFAMLGLSWLTSKPIYKWIRAKRAKTANSNID